MAVDRCICGSVAFAEALACARAYNIVTVGALQRFVPVGASCGQCIPYMQRSPVTGETDLPVLDERERERWMQLSGVRMLGAEE